jgi:hypothetical protein
VFTRAQGIFVHKSEAGFKKPNMYAKLVIV